MKNKFLIVILFFIISLKGISQDFCKILRSKTWYVEGTFYEKQTLKLFTDKIPQLDWYGNFLSTNKIAYNGIIKESGIDQNGNEIAVGDTFKDENYSYSIKMNLITITFHSKATKNQDEFKSYYYYKITESKDKKELVFTPISATNFK